MAATSILGGLIAGLLFFPSMDFQSSILVGNLISKNLFINFVNDNLLFVSFIIAIIVQPIIIIFYSFRISFK